MDAAGIDVQVLSLTSPGTEQAEAADAAALDRGPDRSGGTRPPRRRGWFFPITHVSEVGSGFSGSICQSRPLRPVSKAYR